MNIRFPPDDITSESFVIQWDAVMDLSTVNYTVRWYGEDGSNGTATVNGLSYTVPGLTNSTYYNVTVVAINTCGAGPMSDVVMVITNTSSTTTGITPTPTPTTIPTPTQTTIPTPTQTTIPTPTQTTSPSGNICYNYCY